jgi:hypothetical protein
MVTQNRGQQRSQNGGQKAPPVQKFRAGKIQADVWEQSNANGRWFAVTFVKNYKDAQGAWQKTLSFNGEDLLPLAELSRIAWLWILKQKESEDDQRPKGRGGQHDNGQHGQPRNGNGNNGRQYRDPEHQRDEVHGDIPY